MRRTRNRCGGTLITIKVTLPLHSRFAGCYSIQTFSMRTNVLIACLAVFASSPDRLIAQGETTSAVLGTVVDPSGAALPSAIVTIINTETGLKRMTDDAGRFSFPQLKPGSYNVKVEAAGF